MWGPCDASLVVPQAKRALSLCTCVRMPPRPPCAGALSTRVRLHKPRPTPQEPPDTRSPSWFRGRVQPPCATCGQNQQRIRLHRQSPSQLGYFYNHRAHFQPRLMTWMALKSPVEKQRLIYLFKCNAANAMSEMHIFSKIVYYQFF